MSRDESERDSSHSKKRKRQEAAAAAALLMSAPRAPPPRSLAEIARTRMGASFDPASLIQFPLLSPQQAFYIHFIIIFYAALRSRQ